MFIYRIMTNKWIILLFIIIGILHHFFTKDLYSITAYSNHPISINKPEFLDYRFATMKKTYFGGAAAPKKFPFGTEIELIPLNTEDEKAIKRYFDGKTKFKIEDRGYLVKGKTFDIFLPRRLGGHKTAKRWGRRTMKVKIKKPKK